MGLVWCRTCCTEHTPQENCPSGVRATGVEHEGWRITVETPRGMQGYGVLLAEAGERWRARVLTFPNILWTIPGGGPSMKFVGRTEQDAEAKAIRFIRGHCIGRGFTMRDELEALEPSQFKTTGQIADPASPVAERFERTLPCRFGLNKPVVPASTRNLSATGLFVSTAHPLTNGALCGMLLELEHCKLPLRGSVAWYRLKGDSPQRPAGMGLRLLEPPTDYTRYVRALA